MKRAIVRSLVTAVRGARTAWLVVAVAVAALLVSVVTIDLGPALRRRAEQEGSNFIARPLHIGRLGLNLGRGRLVLEDVRVDGLTPAHDPWLVAGRVELSITWRTLLERRVFIDSVDLSDWTLIIESYAGAMHNMPRLTGPPRPPRTGPRVVTTTLQFLNATRGRLLVRDFGSSWGMDAPNLEVEISKSVDYRGTLRFSAATLLIQQYEPIWANFTGAFTVKDGKIVMDKMALDGDGMQVRGTGIIDATKFPESTFQITSHHQLPRTRAIFYAKDSFNLHGDGDFTGTVHKYSGGYEVRGDFVSLEAGYDDYRFQNFKAAVVWVPGRFDVLAAEAGFYGGQASFTYQLAPLGVPGRRADATWDVSYRDVDLNAFTDFLETRGLRLAGRASGRNTLTWTLGQLAEAAGDGSLTAVMPPGVVQATRTLPDDAVAAARRRGEQIGPFSPHNALGPVPVAGQIDYSFDGAEIRFAPSTFATAETFVAFDGRTAWGDASRVPFHMTSSNWQESHRLLTGIMTMVASPTASIPVDGAGSFDGVILGALSSPQVEGRFAGEAMRAWNVTWGAIEGQAVIENSYAHLTRTVVRSGHSRLDVEGSFALGYPRRDGGEEIDARVRASEWPVTDFRTAFELHDYPVFGAVGGEFHLYGKYEEPFGFGRLTLDRGSAYDEPFASAVASLRFEGAGVRLDGLEIEKAGTTITGAAYVGWDGAYSFNADGRRLAVDALDLTYFPGQPALTGVADFSAAGSGTFEEPRYDVKISVSDLFVGDEGIGQMTAQVALRGLNVLYSFDVASPRLAASGSGQFGLTDAGEIEMTMRLSDASLDPYARVFMPTLSPYTAATGGGSVRVWGEVYTPDALHVEAVIDDLQVRLFDYELRNRGVLRVGLDGQVVRVDQFVLTGDRTALDVSGQVDLARDVVSLRANGEANLAVVQGVLPDVRGSGRAEVSANIGGSTGAPTLSGNALVTDGRLRSFDFPHALEAINGIVTFDASAVRLDGLRANLADGTVVLGGRLGLDGLAVTDYDVTLTGHDLRLRYPEGMRSLVDATLALQGPVSAAVLSGSVMVRSAMWAPQFDANVFGGNGGTATFTAPAVAGAVSAEEAVPLRYDVRVVAPSTLRIENDVARIVARADLNLRGTYDRPAVLGRVEIERGEVTFEGRRYLISRGSIDFTNPDRLLPFFDVEAETRVRVPSPALAQTYRITLRVAGTTERLQPEFTSDPPLPPGDVLSLLLSDIAPAGDAEVASLRSPNQREQELLQARATRALTGALSADVGKVVQQTFGVDTFQITPLLVDPYQTAVGLNVNPAARVTIGKRISERVYLTYARSFSSSTRDEIILLEYEQGDTLGWVLSQNEDGTYALDVRKRVVF